MSEAMTDFSITLPGDHPVQSLINSHIQLEVVGYVRSHD
jgi:hypothetical protein